MSVFLGHSSQAQTWVAVNGLPKILELIARTNTSEARDDWP